ncbi:MAG: tRNA-intron lyase [Thermoplasmatota archaeon]
MPAHGTLRERDVLIADEGEANTIFNKGGYGTPQSGGALVVSLLEALYLAEEKRLDVRGEERGLSPGDLLAHAARVLRNFEIRYVVYRDLRARGFLVRDSGESDFNLFAHGALPGKTASTHLVRALSERGAMSAKTLAAEAARAVAVKKRFLAALVDEEGDLTYYDVSSVEPRGELTRAKLDLASAEPAVLLADRVMVFATDVAEALAREWHAGHDIGPGLQLSLAETLHAMEEAGLRVNTAEGASLKLDGFRALARGIQSDFDLRYGVYRDLVARGLVVKTGFKYGTHFRAYRGRVEEAHAPFLVHALAPGREVAWSEVAGFVRLAHGVRKDIFFASDGSYLRLSRTKP